ncbi:hypothetical protein OL229_04255 [Neisseriaceae bacterium JH1-16]|nr:hypothetical protein [Neisseriaceae bacterium JH1-16]
MTLLIGLTGPAGSGKDTLAYNICHIAPHLFEKIAFADPLRSEVAAAFGLDDWSILTDRTLKELPTGRLALERCSELDFVEAIVSETSSRLLIDALSRPRSPREILQLWGTEYRRQTVATDYWTRQMARRLDTILSQGRGVVISDVRTADEAELTRELGGQVLHIHRAEVEPVRGHVTERAVPVDHDQDHHLHNDDSLDDWRRVAEGVVQAQLSRNGAVYCVAA